MIIICQYLICANSNFINLRVDLTYMYNKDRYSIIYHIIIVSDTFSIYIFNFIFNFYKNSDLNSRNTIGESYII